MSRPTDPDTQVDTSARGEAIAAAVTLPATTATTTPATATLLDGIDYPRRYEAGERLGLGGMGEVRLFEDQLIGRQVALKVIHGDQVDDPDVVQRFLREARVQAQLEHPAIVPIHDVGRTPDGRVYFTMKRVRGRTLAEILDGLASGDADLATRYSRRKLLTGFVSVCNAIELAHQRGVLHRDLKPSNIMLGDFGEVYVLDWGIARIVDLDAAEAAAAASPVTLGGTIAATVAGAIVGTPGYMAPEQARGDLDALDARTDVYALGAILFELLALAPLHPRGSSSALLASTVTGVDASPARRAPAREVPPELDDLCVRATALDQSTRLASVRALSDAVERFLDGDRDLELRRQLSEHHATQAVTLADDALVADDETRRSQAMHEVGRALALDPANQVARRVMVRLLTTPPRTPPADAQARLDASALVTQRFGAWMGVVSYLCWVTAMPIGLWMGVANRGLFAVFIIAHLVALAGSAGLIRAPKIGGTPAALAAAGVWLANASLILVFGSLVLVPTVVAATMTWILLHPRPPSRAAVIAGFSAIIVIPLALELAGVLAPSYRFAGGVMVLVPRMVHHPEAPTLLALVLSTMGTMAVLAFAITRMRRLLSEAEQRLELHAWQLRQLVAES